MIILIRLCCRQQHIFAITAIVENRQHLFRDVFVNHTEVKTVESLKRLFHIIFGDRCSTKDVVLISTVICKVLAIKYRIILVEMTDMNIVV